HLVGEREQRLQHIGAEHTLRLIREVPLVGLSQGVGMFGYARNDGHVETPTPGALTQPSTATPIAHNPMQRAAESRRGQFRRRPRHARLRRITTRPEISVLPPARPLRSSWLLICRSDRGTER